MVGRVPQSPFIYCHPRGHVGISWHTHWHHQRHDCFPTSAAMSQIGQSYLPASTGFIIGALGLMALLAGNGAEECAVRLWFAVSGLYRSSRSPALTAIIVLGAIWLLNDYRGVPTPVLLLTLLLLGGMFMATRTAFGRRIYAIGGNLEAARLRD